VFWITVRRDRPTLESCEAQDQAVPAVRGGTPPERIGPQLNSDVTAGSALTASLLQRGAAGRANRLLQRLDGVDRHLGGHHSA